MIRIEREYSFSPEEEERVRALAEKLSLTETTVSVLLSRGVDTEEKISSFLHPGAENFLSPFLMRGMRETVDLLRRAKEEEWRVAVFGDYDADGIGALSIMNRALTRFGITPYLYVPERTEGYGMSVAALDKIFDDFLPDLILTVDCGISNRKEVEYIKEQGAYCVVTDHHELPDELPDCIIVNPKLKDDYPYDNLCGAGVAFKLACALLGERAYDLVDFAALSTVADSVPLLGENRDIVAAGLERMKTAPRPCFSALIGKPQEITAHTLAFTIAPRVNAAGRMGDAFSALRLFTTEDEEETAALAEKLNAYNAERQQRCDELYTQAAAEIAAEGAYGNIVMLSGDKWNTGFLGIVAAHVVEEYRRPAILFVKRGDLLKGSARSVEKVNIFEALKSCSSLIEEFGGHAQAAGVNVRAENFSALREALDGYIGEKYAREDFVPTLTVCGEGSADRRLAEELNALEPFGMGNRRPLFTMRVGRVDALPLKPQSPHVSFTAGGLDFVFFGGADKLKLLRSGLNKTIVFEYNLSRYRGKEYLKGFVREVVPEETGDIRLDALENALLSLRSPSAVAERRGEEELLSHVREEVAACPYGLCCVCTDPAAAEKFDLGLPRETFRLTSHDCADVLLVAPEPGEDLSAYREVIYLDMPSAVAVRTGRARVLINREAEKYPAALSASREELLSVFSALRRAEGRVYGLSYAEAAKNCGALGFPEELFVFALAVFEELGLIYWEEGTLRVRKGVKTDLMSSRVYAAVAGKEG